MISDGSDELDYFESLNMPNQPEIVEQCHRYPQRQRRHVQRYGQNIYDL